jgi:putative transposase
MGKAYLVSLMDDASRLIPHSAFCPGESALDIEGVLKQAVLKRGRPTRLVIDNGAAYRAKTLQGICARLDIHRQSIAGRIVQRGRPSSSAGTAPFAISS